MARTILAVGSPRGFGGVAAPAHGNLTKFAFRTPRACRPDTHTRSLELVSKALDQPVDGMLARNIDCGICDADEPKNEGIWTI